MDVTQVNVRLREERERRAWTVEEVALRLRTTAEVLQGWENGVPIPNEYVLRKICRLFGMPHEALGVYVESAPSVSPSLVDVRGSVSQDQRAEQIPQLIDPALPPVPTLVGRLREQREVKVCLTGEQPIAVPYGLPGGGKTALVIALAHDPEIRTHFCGGILWAGLGPKANLLGLLSRWGMLLGISSTDLSFPNKIEEWSYAIRYRIGERKMLLVIDDVWSAEEALALKVGGPNCAYLLTTRYPEIASFLALDGAKKIQALDDEDSMNLLRFLAPEVIEREKQRAQELVHAVGGLPLALTLMGHYLHRQAEKGSTHYITAALEYLNNTEERLQMQEPQGAVNVAPGLSNVIQPSLYSVISVTDQQLSPVIRTVFYALSVFPPRPNTFSEEAALVISCCKVDTLDVLMDMGILESSGANRYTLHQTIRDYASLRFQGTAEQESAQRRLVTYMCSFVEANARNFEVLEMESLTVQAALDQAYRLGMHIELLRMVLAWMPLSQVRGFYAQAELQLQRAEQIAKSVGERKTQAKIHSLLGQALQQQGKLALAEQAFRNGLALARELEDASLMSAVFNDLGWLLCKLGNYTVAEGYLREGLHLARLMGEGQRMSHLLRVLGSLSMLRGEYTRSEAYLQESYALAQQGQDRDLMNILLVNLGVSAGHQGNFYLARTYFLEGLQFAREMQHRERISAILSNLGAVEMDLKNYEQAEAYLQEGLLLARHIGHREWIGVHLLNLGETALTCGRLDEGDRYLQESLAIAQKLGHVIIAAKAHYARAQIQLNLSCLEEAEQTLEEMRKIVPEGDQVLHALSQFVQARLEAARGQISLALELGGQCLEHLKALGDGYAREVEMWLEEIGTQE